MDVTTDNFRQLTNVGVLVLDGWSSDYRVVEAAADGGVTIESVRRDPQERWRFALNRTTGVLRAASTVRRSPYLANRYTDRPLIVWLPKRYIGRIEIRLA